MVEHLGRTPKTKTKEKKEGGGKGKESKAREVVRMLMLKYVR